MKLIRSILCAATAVALSILSAASSAQAAELRTVRVSIIPILDIAPLMAASKLGYFAEEGLKIDISSTAGGAVGIPGLIGGAFDITFGNVVSTMLAANQGLPVKIIAPGNQMIDNPAIPEMIGRKGERYATGADFKGKTFAVNNRNNVNWLFARAWIKVKGGDPDKTAFKEVPFPQMADALKRRQVDGVFTVEPFKSATLKDPELAVIGSPYVEVQPGADVGQYISTDAFIAKNPEVIAKFARALQRGIAWYNSNLTSPELAELVADYTRIPLATVNSLRMLPLPTKIHLDQHQKTAALMHTHGMLSIALDASRFIHPIATGEQKP